MPLSDGNFVQENTGATSGTSHAVTLPSGTTAGNTVLVITGSSGSFPATPAGWIRDKFVASNVGAFRLADVTAGQTSWTFTTAGAATVTWYVAEVTELDLVDPFDASASTSGASTTNGGTVSTGTSPAPTAGLNTVAMAIFVTLDTTVTWSGYTNGFAEVVDVAGTSPGLAIARTYYTGTTAILECTATAGSLTSSPATTYAMVISYRSADSAVVAPLIQHTGFEWGTSGGASTGGATSLWGSTLGPSGTWNTNYLIQAGSARNGSYGLRVVQSAGAAFVRFGNAGSAIQTLTAGFNVRVVSATGTPAVAEFTDQAGTTRWGQLVYDAATTKFGVRAGTTGTISYQAGTTALNTWVWVDLRCRINTTTWRVEWRIESGTNTYSDEAAADLTGQSAGLSFSALHLGANQSQTVTVDFDDVVFSRYWTAYPLGPHVVRLLTVDPAGTPTLSGTTTNFSVFTANGTLAAWNATNARNAVDEVPPTISAAADGVTQTAAAASDYIEFPMDTYACTATEFINGVRMLAPLWSGTGAGAGDLAIRGYDGTTETALATASQITPGAPTAVSSTAPVWRCAMWQSTNGWTQAELDAAALRVGFSGDATPDMGVEAVYLEVAVGKTRTRQLFGDFATIEEDPTRLGVVSVTATAPDAGGDSSLYYETSGSPTTVPIGDAATVTTQLNAPDQTTTNYIAFYPPPEGVPDA